MRAIFACVFGGCLVWLFLAALVLSSCTSQARTQTQTRTVGVQAGQEVNLSTTSVTTSSETSGVDVASVMTAALQASQGKILGALEAIKPHPLPEIPSLGAITNAVTAIQKPPGTDWGSLISYGVAAIMAALAGHQASAARMQRKEKQIIEADRDNIYDQHIELCKKLPPENTQKPLGG
jgi:hypothetical protein